MSQAYDPDHDVKPGPDLLMITRVEYTMALVLEVRGELDSYTSPQLHTAITTGFDQAVGRRVVVDLSGLTFFGSAGIGTLTACIQEAGQRPDHPVLRIVVEDNPIVTRPLEATHLGHVLPLYRSSTDAITA